MGQINLVVLGALQHLVDVSHYVAKHFLVRHVHKVTVFFVVALQLEFVFELFNVKEALQVPEGVIGLTFSQGCSNSSLATLNHAP